MTSPFVGAQPTFKDWGGGVLCQSPVFTAEGTVTVPLGKLDGDLTVGFMQALISCTGPRGNYWDADGAPYMTAFAPYAGLPLRDGEGSAGGIFYGPEAQATVSSATTTVSMGDQPFGSLAWTTPDNKGTLQQVVGENRFVTWLVVKSDTTRRIYPLQYLCWNVNWFAAVDKAMPAGVSFSRAMITDKGEGQGPMTPIPSGPLANDMVQPTKWDHWAG